MSSDVGVKKICPLCRKVYPGSSELNCCEDDGAPLEPHREVDLTAGFAGKYRFIRELGKGGWGHVYEVEHLALGKHFAVKIIANHIPLDATAVERFAREAKSLSTLEHPGVVSIVDYGVTPAPFIVMELVQGETLASLLDSSPQLLKEHAHTIFLQLAEVLELAHSKELVHRDIKPENVMYVEYGSRHAVKLLDFGLARANAPGITVEGHVMGTPQYMSPEQFHAADVGPESDIFSLGCVMFEILLGRRAGPDQFRLQKQSSFLQIDDPNYDLQKLVLRCLSFEKTDRPTATAIRQELAGLHVATPRKQRGKKKLVVTSAVAAVLFLIVGGIATKWWINSKQAGHEGVVREVQVARQMIRYFTMNPDNARNSPAILVVTSPNRFDQTKRIVAEWVDSGFTCLVIESPDKILQQSTIEVGNGLLKNQFEGKINSQQIGIAFIGVPPSFGAFKDKTFAAGLVLDPEIQADKLPPNSQMRETSVPVLFVVDSEINKKERQPCAQFCERAFLLSSSGTILLDDARTNFFEENNEDDRQSRVVRDLAARFWKASLQGDTTEKTYITSPQAVHSLGQSTVYKWRFRPGD